MIMEIIILHKSRVMYSTVRTFSGKAEILLGQGLKISDVEI